MSDLCFALSHELSEFSVLDFEDGFEYGGRDERKNAKGQAIEKQGGGLNVSNASFGDFVFDLLKKMGKQVFRKVFSLKCLEKKLRMLSHDVCNKERQPFGFKKRVHIDTDEGVNAFFKRGLGFERVRKSGMDFVGEFGANGFEEVFFGAKIIIQQSKVNICPLRNVAHACAMVAARNKHLHGSSHNFFFR